MCFCLKQAIMSSDKVISRHHRRHLSKKQVIIQQLNLMLTFKAGDTNTRKTLGCYSLQTTTKHTLRHFVQNNWKQTTYRLTKDKRFLGLCASLCERKREREREKRRERRGMRGEGEEQEEEEEGEHLLHWCSLEKWRDGEKEDVAPDCWYLTAWTCLLSTGDNQICSSQLLLLLDCTHHAAVCIRTTRLIKLIIIILVLLCWCCCCW